MANRSELSPLVAPSPIGVPLEIDLEVGPGEQIQCRICLETDGALLFFALLGLSGCFFTCYDRRVRNDLARPSRELL